MSSTVTFKLESTGTITSLTINVTVFSSALKYLSPSNTTVTLCSPTVKSLILKVPLPLEIMTSLPPIVTLPVTLASISMLTTAVSPKLMSSTVTFKLGFCLALTLTLIVELTSKYLSSPE